ncbi:16S rRNA (uracil(1498)-N(3))-methyltransferase [Mesomycoplasma lagogenitalium]|uniref:Ribosomal RNA small subunit methyltransferase E n=1 Tax=Mesomycoplasma lagogenitalium TaxID=171286 RepID=A0ABY8LXC9_9BACT|nr:16S rRNA (uracil(1498)-N(3))-methyltransferase [Mesomycoplasma lagogenitalium]WGI36792.1 16S rRNA (uracil(1498)-N(3))-methyltransferase [Mesomycoplasma lagogenitalium]
MMRFFAQKREGNYFILSKETLAHIKVARVEKENFICIYNEKFYECVLHNDLALIIKEIEENHEFQGEVAIACAIINTKRFEWMIQKATELGATRLIPLLTERVEQKLGEDLIKKVERWNEIAKNAAEQSFRNKPMQVDFPVKFEKVFENFYKFRYIAHEKVEYKINNTFFPQDSIFLIGPEGGFTDKEVQLALDNDYQLISLGKRILRSETAPLFILSRIEE